MRAADTNVLVRLITGDDGRQAAAADRWVERGAWISLLALAEATWVLGTVYERTRDEIATIVEMLLHHRELTLEDPDVVNGALVAFRQRPSIKFSDCLLLGIASKAGHLPLGTFDRDLAKLEGAEHL